VLGCTFDELGRRMSATEYLMWRADYMIEPWGEERADLRAGTIVQSNLMPWSKKGLCLKDCMLDFQEPVKQTWQDMKALLFNRGKAMKKMAKRKLKGQR